jgi:hypothetical protein
MAQKDRFSTCGCATPKASRPRNWRRRLGRHPRGAAKTPFERRHFILKKPECLPRQARDKHRESTLSEQRPALGCGHLRERAGAAEDPEQIWRLRAGKKTRLLRRLNAKDAIILPRQARDKHRKYTQTCAVFLQATIRHRVEKVNGVLRNTSWVGQ